LGFRECCFLTLCEAYMGIDFYFNLWNYFFCIRHPKDPNAELIISGGVAIHVRSGHGVDPYFDILTPRSMKGWQKKWFYLRNNTDVLLPTFTDNHPIPLPT
jgi:hypothetical protein